MKVGVVGLGLIGGSLLRALGGVGYDADPGVRSEAAADGFDVVDSLDRLAGCELILVAVPPNVTYGVVDQVLAAVPDAMVADTASVKGEVPERERFVSAHPMAGAETSGWARLVGGDAARRDLGRVSLRHGAGAAGEARRGGRRARRPHRRLHGAAARRGGRAREPRAAPRRPGAGRLGDGGLPRRWPARRSAT